MVLVSSISNVFASKTSLANNWMSFSSSTLALLLPNSEESNIDQKLPTKISRNVSTWTRGGVKIPEKIPTSFIDGPLCLLCYSVRGPKVVLRTF